MMKKVELEELTLIGIALEKKTSNENGQAGIDCGNMWQKFEKGNYVNKIPSKISDEILAVYHEYDGDYTKPYSYFIGCKVAAGTEVPEGMDYLIIPGTTYYQITAKGKIPECIINVWKEIWGSSINRAYKADFEVYDSRSSNWADAEVDVYLSVKE